MILNEVSRFCTYWYSIFYQHCQAVGHPCRQIVICVLCTTMVGTTILVVWSWLGPFLHLIRTKTIRLLWLVVDLLCHIPWNCKVYHLSKCKEDPLKCEKNIFVMKLSIHVFYLNCFSQYYNHCNIMKYQFICFSPCNILPTFQQTNFLDRKYGNQSAKLHMLHKVTICIKKKVWIIYQRI